MRELMIFTILWIIHIIATWIVVKLHTKKLRQQTESNSTSIMMLTNKIIFDEGKKYD